MERLTCISHTAKTSTWTPTTVERSTSIPKTMEWSTWTPRNIRRVDIRNYGETDLDIEKYIGIDLGPYS